MLQKCLRAKQSNVVQMPITLIINETSFNYLATPNYLFLFVRVFNHVCYDINITVPNIHPDYKSILGRYYTELTEVKYSIDDTVS